MREPMTMTGEYEASIRKADARACKGGQVPSTESLPGQRKALLDEVDYLRGRLDAAEACIAAADKMREGYDAHEVVGYDAARDAWRQLRGGEE
jgi:hypothetical protein